MVYHVGLARECLAAHSTAVRLLAGMHALMSFEAVRLCERLSTHTAAIWFLACVGPLVDVQVAAAGKTSAAHGAYVELFARVLAQVDIEHGVLCETLAAQVAEVQLVASGGRGWLLCDDRISGLSDLLLHVWFHFCKAAVNMSAVAGHCGYRRYYRWRRRCYRCCR